MGDFAREVGGEFAKIVFDNGLNEISDRCKKGPEQVHRAALITAQRYAPQVQNYARDNAVWTDRTGNARQGLMARPFEEGDSVGIDVFHSVSYGIWLEVRWGGRYAIIQPTIDVMGPKVMQGFDGLLDRIR